MNEFKALVQLQLRGYGLNKLRHQSKKKQLGVWIGAVLLVLLALSYLLGIAFMLIQLDLASYIPTVMVFLSSVICLVLTFMKGSNLLFGYRDFDVLMSLPISIKVIITSKIFGLYLLNLLFSFLANIPAMLLYCWHIQNYWAVLGAIFLVPFIPLLPLILGILLTTVISLIAANFRYQQLIVVLLSIGLVIGLMLGSLSLTNYTNNEMSQLLKQSLNHLEQGYPLLVLIRNGFAGQPLFLLAYIALSTVSALAFWLVLTHYYLQINTKLTLRTKKSVFAIEKFKQRRVFFSLLSREARLYFSSALYVTNTILGVIMFLVAALSLPFVLDQMTAALPAGFTITQAIPWLPYAACFFLGIATPTSAAISMEGKNRWLYASLPISTVKIYGAKLILSFLLFLPPLWIGCVALIFTFEQSLLSAFLLVLLPTCFCVFILTVSLKLNQLYPNFSWLNEQQVIKQGLPVLVTMLIGFVSIAFALGSAVLINNPAISVISISILFLLISVLCWRSLRKKNVFIG